MLKRRISKLRLGLNSKGKPNPIKTSCRYFLQGIPVLSIFALVGIISYGIAVSGIKLASDNKAYAVGSTTNATSASLIIDNNTTYDKINATYNDTNYVSHQVRVNASNIDDYKLTITGPTSLTGPSGSNASSSDVSSWGYAWSTANSNASTLSYKNFTGSAETLTGEAVDTTSNTVDFTRTLAFAAKFTDNATEGHYTASVNLNLTVTPKAVTSGALWSTGVDSGITTMQEMTASVCNQVATPTTGTAPTLKLKDTRDGGVNSYTIAKLKDGNCWMVENLKLDLTKAGVATSAESDNLSANWPTEALPNRFDTASTNAWENTNTLAEFSKAPAKIYSTYPGDGNGYQSAYGYYYSWCAATAGCKDESGNNPDANVDAVSSICPKGWKLPKGGTDPTVNNFAVLMAKDGVSLPNPLVAGSTNVSWSSNLDNTVPATMTLGGTKWYRAGYVTSNGLSYPGSIAYYWSRTASSSTGACNLRLNSSGDLYPAYNYYRYYGVSVRCVAERKDEITYSITYKYSGQWVYGLPEAEVIKTADETYDFKIPDIWVWNSAGSSRSGGPVISWIGSDGNEYKKGDIITLTENNSDFSLTVESVNSIYDI